MFIRVLVGLEIRPSVFIALGAFSLWHGRLELSCRVQIGLATGDWRLATGDWRLATRTVHLLNEDQNILMLGFHGDEGKSIFKAANFC